MAYSDFTLESAVRLLSVTIRRADLFPSLVPAIVPGWLTETLLRGEAFSLVSEKSRSELIVSPILMAARELSNDRLAVVSGIRFDVDSSRGLAGECDFILALGLDTLPLKAPIAAVVEAKKQDIEAGTGQCIAQLVAAQEFNRSSGSAASSLFGCVTTGDDWQFIKLEGTVVSLHPSRLYLVDVARILGAFLAIVAATDVAEAPTP